MTKKLHDWRDGIEKIPIHLATWGLGGALASVWLGWIPLAFVLGQAVRGEYQDVKNGDDTAAKAVIDFASQVGPALAAALALNL